MTNSSITATDTSLLEAPVELVWASLLDFSCYRNWWPWLVGIRVLRVTPEVVGSRFRVRPMGGLGFTCEIHDISPLETMTIRYIRGVYQGVGTWHLEPIGQRTLINYTIDLEMKSIMVRWLSRWLDVAEMHSRQMQQLFWGLETASQQRAQRTQPVFHGESA